MKLKQLLFTGLFMLVFKQNQAQIAPGYTLYSVQNATSAQLLDTNGNTFHSWNLTGRTGYASYLLENGVLLRAVSKGGNSFMGGPICGEVQKVDWNGNIIWDYIYSTTSYCSHHDICPLPNGNVLLIAYERKTAAEVTAAGGTNAIEMWPDKIVEIQPVGSTGGNVVWEWHAWDHLVQNKDATKANYYNSIADHPELLHINYNQQKDWIHMNGLDYNDSLDQIAFSSHNLNEIYIIDHSTTTAEAASHSGGKSGKGGDILYRWGNPAAYNTAGTKIFSTVHDAHWIDKDCPKAGYLVGFNNNGVSTSQSAVDFIDPPDSGYIFTKTAGVQYTPNTYTKRIAVNGFTSNMGNSQQLPNGNTLICVALSGKIYEVNAAGTVVWTKQIQGSVPQAHKYPYCYVTGNPSAPVISQNGNTLTSSATVNNIWYRNDSVITGASSNTYLATLPGVYKVRVQDANGCQSDYSNAITINPGTGINYESNSQIQVYPNPASGQLYIEDGKGSIFRFKLINTAGMQVLEGQTAQPIALDQLAEGLYIIILEKDQQISASFKITVQR